MMSRSCGSNKTGATCHTARATIDLLKDTFGDRLISRFGLVDWPPRSCDLTPLDYFLRGYVKSLVYADKPQTLDHLEDNIRRVIADIRPQMLKKVIENWTSRLDYIRASRGSHMPEIIFKICQVIYSRFGLAIHQNDHQARRRFVEWSQNEIAVVPDFHKRILFSDEAHFWLNGYVNKQNCRIWSEANAQVLVETPLHPEKLTVWCALWAGGITGPYFFKNDEGHYVTVNGDRYRAMITNFFIPELNNHDIQELWFQQDDTTCHTARATIDLLKDTFGDRLISRFGPVNWPPRSCDLTPIDYFLWGYVKSLVYMDKPQTLDHLEDNIRRVIADIRSQMLENSSKIGRPDWTTSDPAVAVICQKSYIKSIVLNDNKLYYITCQYAGIIKRFLRRLLAVTLQYRNPIESSKVEATAAGSIAFILARLQRST
ncbi:transposable element Tc3 transposase [Trichonephila clavipes]|nr:transposable element Tc3 transposase [Trichonephila clavipes]